MKTYIFLVGTLCFAVGITIGTLSAHANLLSNSQEDGSLALKMLFTSSSESSSNIQLQGPGDAAVKEKYTYQPASTEQYIMDNVKNWHWDEASGNPSGCDIWTNPSATTGGNHAKLNAFRSELKGYYNAIEQFKPIRESVMKFIRRTHSHKICEDLRLHPDGLKAFFPSQQLSYTSMSGYVEPLATPMRHPDFCFDVKDKAALMDMNYLIHDFEHHCRRLKPTSRVVLIDLGASLFYHEEKKAVAADIPPIVHLLRLYEKFGFYFDHVYAFEVTFKQPQEVFETLDIKYMPNYHWINVGVNPERGHKLNPLDSILRNFDEDDMIVLKVDVDTHSVELPLVQQLLEDETLHRLVDQFYFEHHVKWKEMLPIWRSAARGSLKDTLDLFRGLREKGVAAHFWP